MRANSNKENNIMNYEQYKNSLDAHRKALKLQRAFIVQPLGLPTLIRDQQPDEIMIKGVNGFYFLKKVERKLYYAEYFGIRELKDFYCHTSKIDAIESCKQRLDKEVN